jgi:hypothetical protein
MRRFRQTLALSALMLAAVAVGAANAQPPVARPQPPPPAPNTKAPAKPGTAATPTPSSPQQPGATRQAPPPAAAPATQAPATPAQSAQAPAAQPKAQASNAETPPAPSQLNAPVIAGAQYLGSYDAGMGQTYYLYGSTQSFADAVTYYRTVLKDRGELVFDAPATHMFEVGKFKETDVAFPPGVTVKDYTWGGSPGYMNPTPGASPAFFPTVIQIVPPPGAPAGRRD